MCWKLRCSTVLTINRFTLLYFGNSELIMLIQIAYDRKYRGQQAMSVRDRQYRVGQRRRRSNEPVEPLLEVLPRIQKRHIVVAFSILVSVEPLKVVVRSASTINITAKIWSPA